MEIDEKRLPSDKNFGIFFATLFLFVGIILFFKALIVIPLVISLAAVVLFFISLTNSKLLNPLNRLWMKFGFILGKIFRPIVLGILFYFIFTPVALVMKLLSRDELSLKPKNSASYWKKRESQDEINNSFKNQF